MLQVNRLLVHSLVVLQLVLYVLYFLNSTRLVMVKLTCFSSDTCWQQIKKKNNVTPPLFQGFIYTIATFDSTHLMVYSHVIPIMIPNDIT